MAQLEHVLDNGVHFDTEVQYIVRHVGRVKHEKLPIRGVLIDGHGSAESYVIWIQ